MFKLIAVCIALAVGLASAGPRTTRDDKVLICYFASWATYRNGQGAYNIENIDPNVCTHLVYAFAGFDNDGKIASFDPYNDLTENWGKGNYVKFNKLVQENQHLTSLLAIGGWNEGSTRFSKVAATQESRTKFANSVVVFLKKYGFQGLDVDWEYPTLQNGAPEDKANFVLLLKTLSDTLRPEGLKLTIAVGASEQIGDAAYDIPGIVPHVDYIILMTFDYHTAASMSGTGHSSPLRAAESDSDNQKKLTTEYSVNYWLSKGAPRNKLVVGMPVYGRTFTLANPSSNGVGAPITGPGKEGPYTHEPGYLAYYEICAKLETETWAETYDPSAVRLYITRENQWVSYDDVRTVTAKAQFIVDEGLAGAMAWPMDNDDFHGNCGIKHPVQKAIRKVLNQ